MTTETPTKTKDLVLTSPEAIAEQEMFILAQSRANVYAQSDLVPKEYRKNIANVMIATNMAKRMGADVLQVMQNLYIVHGKPGWSAQFLISMFNESGDYTSIRYRFTGEKGTDSWGCIAYCTELATGDEISGTEVTIAMSKAEGWGTKWKTMPEQMLRYRAASFLIRTTAPQLGMGLQTKDEIEDVEQRSTFRPRGNLQSSQLVLDAPKSEHTTSSGELPFNEPDGDVSELFASFTARMNKTTKAASLVALAAEVDNAEGFGEDEQDSLLAELSDRIKAAKAAEGAA